MHDTADAMARILNNNCTTMRAPVPDHGSAVGEDDSQYSAAETLRGRLREQVNRGAPAKHRTFDRQGKLIRLDKQVIVRRSQTGKPWSDK